LIDVLQLALEPLWKLYEVCNQGTDVKAVLSKAVKSLGLTQVRLYSSYTVCVYVTPYTCFVLIHIAPCISLLKQTKPSIQSCS